MSDREKVIKGLEFCTQHGSICGSDCNGYYERYTDDGYVIKRVNEYRSKCPYGKCETGCVKTLAKDALELLKEQEPEPVGLYGKDDWYGLVCVCPDCKAEWMSDKSDTHFCPNCGKAVKWDDT